MTFLTCAAAIGAGLIAGVFFTFSNFVMAALARTPGGAAAMREINRTVLNPGFLGVFLGTAVVCLLVAVLAMFSGLSRVSMLQIAGSACYVLGTFLVTIVRNVPLNDRLVSNDDDAFWAEYLRRWTFWNHVRTVAAVASAILLVLSLNLDAF